MEDTNRTEVKPHPLKAMFATLWQRRKVFYWLWPATFVLSAALILCVPRYYTCEVILAPELQGGSTGGSIQSLASSFGFDISSLNSADALYPQLYPELLASPDFLVKLFDTRVSNSDATFEGTYYEYITTQRKLAFWKRWKYWLQAHLMPQESTPILKGDKDGNGVNVFCLTKRQRTVIEIMQDDISCEIDKKTDMITIHFSAQDKLVCAIMGDSVCTALQDFITNYRTKKNRIDLTYYEDVMNRAYSEYQEASKQYIRYVDSHGNIHLEQYRIEAQNLESEMQLKQAAYTTFQKQYLATQARLQENTPVFTVIKSASVPKRPAGPKRMIFVLGMLILATGIAFCVVCKEELSMLLMSENDDD